MSKKHKKSADMSSVVMITLLVLVLGFGIFILVQSVINSTTNTGTPATQTQKAADIDYSGQPHQGQANAPIKLVEFGDFKCPNCKRFHDLIYPQLKKDYIDTGKVQMFFMNMPFIGPDSATAAQAGEAVYKQNNDAFWKYYDAVYANQKDEKTIWATPDFLVGLVKQYIPEVNADQVKKDMADQSMKNQVVLDGIIANHLQVNEVPKLFINGKVVQFNNYADLKKALDAELAKK